MRGVAAQRIVRTIRKPRNKADEAIAPKPGWDGAFRAFCFVARLANRARRSAEEGPLWGSDREGAHLRPQRQRTASRAGVASTRYARGVLLRPARSPCYWHRLASRISSRKASVATTRGLFRGSLISDAVAAQARACGHRRRRHCRGKRRVSPRQTGL